MIDRKKIVRKHNPFRQKIEWLSPLTVGNGSIAYTTDITGMQTLCEEQAAEGFPLLTMSEWGWHTTPTPEGGIYDLDRDLVMTEYPHKRGTVRYPVKKQPGNEKVYDWLRENPHRYNLVNMGLVYQGKPISAEQLKDVEQHLDLYSGILYSTFTLWGKCVTVETMCHQKKDVLSFVVRSELMKQGDLQVALRFPYGSWNLTGSDWQSENRHRTNLLEEDDHTWRIEHLLDWDSSYLELSAESGLQVTQERSHEYLCKFAKEETAAFTVSLAEKAEKLPKAGVEECRKSSVEKWKNFWETGAFISFEGSLDARARELERRIILSLYVSAVNSCGSMPPQETGLTINSWFGKAHLEMYFWHLAYLPLWGRSGLLKKSLAWYQKILPKAIHNARRNNYKGAKWPKMVGPEGVDSPSPISPLLLWQQPHPIYMLELVYQAEKSNALLEEYWDVVRETADYMDDFAEYNAEKGVYELTAPVIPAQEVYRPEDTLNPAFEVEYWQFGLKLAVTWAKRLHRSYPEQWEEVADHMAQPRVLDGVYLGHELCETSYTEYAKDHPSVVAAMGLLPGERINPKIMQNTLDKIYQSWDFGTLWGWDFAMMAMTETRLGNPERALDILLNDTPQNQYMSNGHNLQESRSYLTLYLPGNGSLLFAIPLMAMGYPGCGKPHPGFPSDGSWKIEVEGMMGFPY